MELPALAIKQPDLGDTLYRVAAIKNAGVAAETAGLQNRLLQTKIDAATAQLSARQKLMADLQGSGGGAGPDVGGAEEAAAPGPGAGAPKRDILQRYLLAYPEEGKQIIDGLDKLDERDRAATKQRLEDGMKFLLPIQFAPPEQRPMLYAQQRAAAAQAGLPMDGVPEQYDPSYVERAIARGMATDQYLSMKEKGKVKASDLKKVVGKDGKLRYAKPEDAVGAEAPGNLDGKYYAVQTGSGTMLVNKDDGTSIMLGVNEKGEPVQVGKPFRPSMSASGQPLPVPESAGVPNGDATPAATSVKPMMPPSIDAAAQGATAKAKAVGQAEGEREGTAPERLKAAKSAMNQLETQHDVMMKDIDRAIENAGFWTTGLIGSMASGVAGTDAHDLANIVNTIKANVGFDKLQAMREASPTGGALGQVSERENTLLQSTLGALEQSQSEEQFVGNLKRLQTILQERRAARREAYKTDFGEDFGGSAARPEGSAAGGGWKIERVR